MSGRSVWAFTMPSQRQAIANAHRDQTRKFHHTCEMKQKEKSVSKVNKILLAEKEPASKANTTD